jgi:hypothetical protein
VAAEGAASTATVQARDLGAARAAAGQPRLLEQHAPPLRLGCNARNGATSTKRPSVAAMADAPWVFPSPVHPHLSPPQQRGAAWMRIAMIGGGYVGLVSAACFAEFGGDITVMEVDADKLAMHAGRMPIYEPGLDRLVAENVPPAASRSPATSPPRCIPGSVHRRRRRPAGAWPCRPPTSLPQPSRWPAPHRLCRDHHQVHRAGRRSRRIAKSSAPRPDLRYDVASIRVTREMRSATSCVGSR